MSNSTYTMTHLWEMPTSWFPKPKHEHVNATFTYKSWNDFRECKPYKLWKPYIPSSWSWTKTEEERTVYTKRNEFDKHTMLCNNMLRTNPSSHDKEHPAPLDTSNRKDMLQIVFLSPDRFDGMHRVEMSVKEEDEDQVREWLKSHMPAFWKL